MAIKGAPTLPDQYQGKQVIINSDRLVFNAKDDSILMFTNQHISFSSLTGNIHFDMDGENNFVVNSDNIYLGINSAEKLSNEPAILGNKLAGTGEWLEELILTLQGLSNVLKVQYTGTSTAPGAPIAPNPANMQTLSDFDQALQDLNGDINDLMSTHVFIKDN